MKIQPYRCPSCDSNSIQIDKQNRMHCMNCGTVSQIFDSMDIEGDSPELIHEKANFHRADAQHVRAKADKIRAKATYLDAETRRREVDYEHAEHMAEIASEAGNGFADVMMHIYNVLRRPLMIIIWVALFPVLFKLLPWPSIFESFFGSIGQWLFNIFCFIVLLVGGIIVIIRLWSRSYDMLPNRKN